MGPLERANDRLGWVLGLLERLVRTPSHASRPESVAHVAELLVPPLRELGFEPEILRRDQGVHFSARREAKRATAPAVLLLGHMDTVFEPGHAFSELTRDGDRWVGPGVADMKGGLVTAVLALAATPVSVLDALDVRVLFVGDEEQGSPTAGALLRDAARGLSCALCFEAAREDGNLVSARKGYLEAAVEVRGPGGHAGMHAGERPHALLALSDFLLRVEQACQSRAGVSFSPGGHVEAAPAALNCLPERAHAQLELRAPARADLDWAEQRLCELAREVQDERGAHVELHVQPVTPPMQLDPGGERLLWHYRTAAGQLGFRVDGVATAGVGDINLVAHAGAACLDGVGPLGGGFHTSEEWLDTSSIAPRAAMTALVLQELSRAGSIGA